MRESLTNEKESREVMKIRVELLIRGKFDHTPNSIAVIIYLVAEVLGTVDGELLEAGVVGRDEFDDGIGGGAQSERLEPRARREDLPQRVRLQSGDCVKEQRK
jgi:hypothetical protein